MTKLENLIAQLCPEGVEFKSVGELCERVFAGGTPSTSRKDFYDGEIPWLRSGEVNFNKISSTERKITEAGLQGSSAKMIRPKSVLLAMTGATVARSAVNMIELSANQSVCAMETNEGIINYKFLYYYLSHNYVRIKNMGQGALTSLNVSTIKSLQIPVPPLEVQEEIVRILDKFTSLEAELEAELEARKKQYEHYRNQLLTFNTSPQGVRWTTLGEILKYQQPTKYIVKSKEFNNSFTTPVLTAGKTFILGKTNEISGIFPASKENPVIIFDDFTTSNHWVDFLFKIKSSAMKILQPNTDDLSFRFVYYMMQTVKFDVGAEHSRQWISKYSKIKIPLPPLEKQREIVEILDKFEALTSSISTGLPAEITARRKQYEYYRAKLLDFKPRA
ncbi:MAG: restriction endonuclease subunit S [bacterium]|nr:restriction endonuclease subunit S [bacterium]